MKKVMLALSLAAGVSGNAMADVWATASMSGLGYTLFDLDASDGIAPALTFLPAADGQPGGAYSAQSHVSGNGIYDPRQASYAGDSSSAPVSLNLTFLPHYQLSGSLTGRGGAPELQVLNSEIHIDTEPDDVYRRAQASQQSDKFFFTLTPNTGVAFYSMLRSVGGATSDRYGESVNINGALHIRVENGDPEHPTVTSGSASAWADGGGYGARRNFDELDLVNVTYLNRSGAEQEGYVMMQLHTSGYGDISVNLPPPAVPEPSSYAMLGAGIGLLGFLRRRKQ